MKVEWDTEFRGFSIDAAAYLAALPGLKQALPDGAWEFVSDAGHYSFSSDRCVKDLELAEVSLPVTRVGGAGIGFLPNPWKHPAGLRIEYVGVTGFSVEYHDSIDWMESITVLLDEVRPAPGGGIVHEIELTDATIVVRCADLVAVWQKE
ncbi:hypothetical protein ACFWY6_12840 [Streptomyces sp. NPDC059037]|uniref:hypothetical protein n=1 Tax=Streptomyces sp. NPDC059037 TaxID=3346710 RepID=UPI003679AB41